MCHLLSLIALVCFVDVVLSADTAQKTEELRKEFQRVKAKVEKGDVESQYDLALMYYEGKGVEKDYTEAKRLWREIADKGHALAQSNLMAMHEKGQGVSNANAITGGVLLVVIAFLVCWVIYMVTVEGHRVLREHASRDQERRDQERQQQEQQRKRPTQAESKPKPKRTMPPDVHSAFVALALNEDASLEDVRHAYRMQVKQYHPDKVAHLGADLRKLAETKTKEINAAYAKLVTFYASSK